MSETKKVLQLITISSSYNLKIKFGKNVGLVLFYNTKRAVVRISACNWNGKLIQYI